MRFSIVLLRGLVVLCAGLMLFACARPEKTVLGVPQSVWNQLAPNEQQEMQSAYTQEHAQQH